MTLPIVYFFCNANHAYAYIDPGTGSIILQVLLGLILGIVYTLKTYWLNVKDFVSRVFKKKSI
ncbi:MAG: hypothetical protein C4527_13300 [Candidatus Omnitrophota bacterium]|nr:MAG: hypothetical protein C4527_13300 [Candidatus Omnitrophota bacterium]